VKTIHKIFILLFVISLCSCATTEQSSLEDAQTALDNEDYDSAIDNATEALAEDSTNAAAARVLSNAYFGRSGIRFLDVMSGIFDLEENADDSNFAQIAAVLPDPYDTTITEADVRLAIETLEGFAGIDATSFTDDDLADAAFDLGLMEAIEHFSLGVYGADYFGTFDVTGITDDDAAAVQEDLLNFDNRLVAAGVDETDNAFISDIRQTFCILKDISAADGFTTAEYQALVGCELDDDPDTFDTLTLTADIANCAALDPDGQTADVQACYDEDTTL
jgi:hypothetical protein